MSDLCGTVPGMVTMGGGGMSTEGETLQVSVVLCGTWSATSLAPSQVTQFWQIARQNALLSPVHAMFRHDCPPSGETCKYATAPITPPPPQKKSWRDSLPIDMLLSAVSVLVVALPISEIPEGFMNHPVFVSVYTYV
jgi:hypothetical protein